MVLRSKSNCKMTQKDKHFKAIKINENKMVKIKIPYQMLFVLESCIHSALHTLLWPGNKSLRIYKC